MQELRKRKQKRNKQKKKELIDTRESIECVNVVNEAAVKVNGTFWTFFYILFGLAVAGFLGYKYAAFIKLMHENDMWFSEISVS